MHSFICSFSSINSTYLQGNMVPTLVLSQCMAQSHCRVHLAQLMLDFTRACASNTPIPSSTQMLQKNLFAEESQGNDPKPGTFSDLQVTLLFKAFSKSDYFLNDLAFLLRPTQPFLTGSDQWHSIQTHIFLLFISAVCKSKMQRASSCLYPYFTEAFPSLHSEHWWSAMKICAPTPEFKE